jgi:hypothetical protein
MALAFFCHLNNDPTRLLVTALAHLRRPGSQQDLSFFQLNLFVFNQLADLNRPVDCSDSHGRCFRTPNFKCLVTALRNYKLPSAHT